MYDTAREIDVNAGGSLNFLTEMTRVHPTESGRGNLLGRERRSSRSYCVARRLLRLSPARAVSGSKKNSLNSFPINRFLGLDYRPDSRARTDVIQIARPRCAHFLQAELTSDGDLPSAAVIFIFYIKETRVADDRDYNRDKVC